MEVIKRDDCQVDMPDNLEGRRLVVIWDSLAVRDVYKIGNCVAVSFHSFRK